MNKSKYFKSVYFKVVVLVVVTAILISTLMLGLFRRQIKDMIKSQSRVHLAQLSSAIDMMNESGTSLDIKLYYDRDIVPILFGVDVPNDKIIRGVIRLNAYRDGNPFIESIYVYNEKSGYIYTTDAEGRFLKEDFYDKEFVAYIQDEISWEYMRPVPRRVKNKDVFSFVYQDSGMINGDKNVVVINFSQSILGSYFEQLGSQNETILIADQSGNVVAAYGEKIHFDEMPESVLCGDNTEDTLNIDGKSYILLSQSVSDMKEWKCIDIIALKVLYEPVDKATFGIIGLICISGVLLTVFAKWFSKRTVKPLEDNYKSLYLKYNKKNNMLRNAVFQELLNHEEQISHEKLEQYIDEYKVSLLIEKPTVLITIKMADTSSDELQDKDLLLFSIGNICEEIGNRHVPTLAVNMQDKRIVMIMNLENDMDKIYLKQTIVLPILDVISKYCKEIKFQAVIGEVCENMYLAFYQYKLMQKVEKNFLLKDTNIICVEDIREDSYKEYDYPKKQEEQYFAQFRIGNAEKANLLVRNIILEAQHNTTYQNFLNLVYHMAYSISNILNELDAEFYLKIQNNQYKLLRRVEHAKNVEEIIEEFEKMNWLAHTIVKQSKEEEKDREKTSIVEQVDSIIVQEYDNMNMSIQFIADKLHLSATYLGRVYKKNSSISITEKITQYRMDIACEKLMEDVSVAAISEQCGFGNVNYFYKVFKKQIGMTPNEYKQIQNTSKNK